MNETKRILMAKRIERAVNDKLASKEIKTYCSGCGHILTRNHDDMRNYTA